MASLALKRLTMMAIAARVLAAAEIKTDAGGCGLMNEKAAQASELFENGLYCSQAVFGAFSESYGIDKETAFKISCGLNSGVRCAELCGAVSGAVLVIGAKYGDDHAKCNAKTEEFLKLFRANNGDIVCRDILGCDISTPDGKEKAASENLFKTVCKDMVASAAGLLCDLGY
jgi:C_GCAxxG_C_C family probable redox protein